VVAAGAGDAPNRDAVVPAAAEPNRPGLDAGAGVDPNRLAVAGCAPKSEGELLAPNSDGAELAALPNEKAPPVA
jgi:hypothetical protein